MTDDPSTVLPPSHPAPRPVVLQVLPALDTGGVEIGTVDVAKFLKRAGAQPLVASEGGRLVPELVRAGIPHFTLPLASKNPLTMRANVSRLADLIEEQGVDIVHARSRAPAWSAFFAAKRTGRAFLTTFHAQYKFGSPVKKFYNSVMARGERVIAISNFIAEHIQRSYGLDPARIRVIPRGIDLVKFNPDYVTAERMASLAQEWRLPDGLRVILCPGRLSRIKGQLVLLEALAKLPRRDFICVLVGSDQGRFDYSEELARRAVALGLEGHVSMVGECTDMATAYTMADVVVAPSIVAEGFGRVPVEAQAMGRPIVASDIGGMRETVIPGETGWLCRVNDPVALAETLEAALNLSPEQRMRLATKAVTHVHTHFSKDEMCWATLDVYQELYGQPVPWAMAAEQTGT